MTRKQRLAKSAGADRGHTAGARASKGRASQARSRKSRAKGIDLYASAENPKKHLALHAMNISDFYRPLKKPVTLRLDADVIAWFKRGGKRYQTRINYALRKVMEREMKAER